MAATNEAEHGLLGLVHLLLFPFQAHTGGGYKDTCSSSSSPLQTSDVFSVVVSSIWQVDGVVFFVSSIRQVDVAAHFVSSIREVDVVLHFVNNKKQLDVFVYFVSSIREVDVVLHLVET